MGDDLRRIHWRSTARLGELIVREDESAWQPETVLVLDNRAGAHRRGTYEAAIEALASIAVRIGRAGRAVDILTTAGHRLGAVGGEGLRIETLLDELAVLTPDPDAPIARRDPPAPRAGPARACSSSSPARPTTSRRSPRSPGPARPSRSWSAAGPPPTACGRRGDRRRRPAGRARDRPGTAAVAGGRRRGRRRPPDRIGPEHRDRVLAGGALRRPRPREHRRRARVRAGVRRRRIRRPADRRGGGPPRGRAGSAGCATGRSRARRCSAPPPPRSRWCGSPPASRRSSASRPAGTVTRVAHLLDHGWSVFRTGIAPVPPTPGVVLLCALTVGAVAVAADTIARRPDTTIAALATHAGALRAHGHARHRRPARAHDDRLRRRRARRAHDRQRIAGGGTRRTWFTGRRLASDASVVRSAVLVGGAALLVGLVLTPLIPGVDSGRC